MTRFLPTLVLSAFLVVASARAELAVVDVVPINPLLDPLGVFGQEAGEQPRVGALPRLALADFDGDGDLDLFVGDDYGRVRYLENVADPGEAAEFVELIGAASPTSGLDFSADGRGDGSVDGPTSPAVADLDGDGDLDLFVGHGYVRSGTGCVTFFENLDGTLVRADGSNPIGGLLFNLIRPVPRFADLDRDGDLDLFVGGKEVSSANPSLYYLENEGTRRNPVFVDRTGQVGKDPFALVDLRSRFVQELTAPEFADLDGDGDLDALVGQSRGVRFFRNDGLLTGTPVLTELTGSENPLAGNGMREAAPLVGDIDLDGDLDLFLAGGGSVGGGQPGFVQFLENTGTAVEPCFLSVGDRLELVDLDDDGDLDALVSTREPALEPLPRGTRRVVWWFENQGSDAEPVWKLQSGPDNPFSVWNTRSTYAEPDGALPLSPVVEDLDGDGLLEAFVAQTDGFLEYLEDDGTGQLDPAATHPLEGVLLGVVSDLELADLDGDGELDLVVSAFRYGYRYPEPFGQVSVFLNETGSGGIDAMADLTFEIDDPWFLAPTTEMVDFDDDGDLDLVLGGDIEPPGPRDIGFLGWIPNTGSPAVPDFDPSSLIRLPVEVYGSVGAPSPALADLDGDGDLDLMLGNSAGVEVFLTGPPEDVAGPSSVLEIPTLSQWGAILFGGLLSLAGWLGVRRMG